MEWLTRGGSFYSSMTKGLGSQCRVRLAPQNIEIIANKASNSLSMIYNHSQWALKAMLAFFCSEENLGINCTCIFLDLRI